MLSDEDLARQRDYQNKRSAGRYHFDDTNGHGPETYTLEKIAGTYRVAVRLHSGALRTTVGVHVDARGAKSERTFVLQRSGEEQGFEISP